MPSGFFIPDDILGRASGRTPPADGDWRNVDRQGNEVPTAATQAASLASTGAPTRTSRSTSVSVTTRGSDGPPPELPDASANERAAMQTRRDFVANPFDNQFISSLVTAISKEGQAIQNAQQTVSRVVEESSTLGSQLQQDLRTLIGVKEAINNKVGEEFKQLEAQRMEGWDRQQRILNQRKRVQQMNPLLQAIKGMFDPNFSRQALDTELGIEKALDAENVRIFQERTQSARYLAELATANYDDKEKLLDLVTRNGGRDLQLAMQALTLAGAETNNLVDQLAVDNKIEQARLMRIENTLAYMSAGQVKEALKAAALSPEGVAMVNGVPVPLGALQDQEAVILKRGLLLKQLDLAVRVTDKELQEFSENEILAGMGRAELRKLLEDGGVYEGRQLDMVKIAERLNKVDAAEGVISEDASLGAMKSASLRAINESITGGNRAVSARFEQLMGSAPGEFNDYLRVTSQTLRAYAAGGQAAEARGIGEKYYADNYATIQGLVQQRNEVIKAAVNRWAGSNKDLQALGMAWMTGQQIDSGVAARSLIHFARNGPPQGGAFARPEAQLALRIAREEVQKDSQGAQAGRPGDSIQALLESRGSAGKAEREQQLTDRIISRLNQAYRSTVSDQASLLLPKIAKERGLAFGQISGEQWLRTVQDGDSQGLANTARQLNGMTPEAFQRMMREGPSSQLWKNASANLQGEQANFDYWTSVLAASQMQATYALLDSRFSRPGFDAPAALREAIATPQYLAELRKGVEASGNTSLGSYIASAVSGTSEIMGDAANQQSMWQRSYATYTQAKRTAQINAVRDRAHDPLVRTQYILSASEASDETIGLVMRAVELQFGPKIGRAKALTPSGVFHPGLNREIDDFILTAKTGDPQLDAALKAVRPSYKMLAGPMTQSFRRTAGE